MIRPAVTLTFLMIWPIGAFGEENCADVLNEKLLDRSNVIEKKAANDAVQNYYCSKSYQEVRDGKGFELGISYGIFDGNVKGNQQAFQSWQSSNCGGLSASESEQSLYYNSQIGLNVKSIGAWESCMTARSVGLSCYVKPPNSDQSSFIFIVHWNTPGLEHAASANSYIDNGVSTRTKGAHEIYDKGTSIGVGDDQVPFIVTYRKRGTILSLSVRYGIGNQMFACDGYLPGQVERPEVGSDKISGRWCGLTALGKTAFDLNTSSKTSVRIYLDQFGKPVPSDDETTIIANRSDTEFEIVERTTRPAVNYSPLLKDGDNVIGLTTLYKIISENKIQIMKMTSDTVMGEAIPNQLPGPAYTVLTRCDP